MSKLSQTDLEPLDNLLVGCFTPNSVGDFGVKLDAHDRLLEFKLEWSSLAEPSSFDSPTVSLLVQEQIEPGRKPKNADLDRLEAYRKTFSLPFDTARDAIGKIVDDRGVENLGILELR